MTASAVRAARRPATSGGGPLTGSGALTRLALRRDRIMLPAWVYVVVIGVASNACTFAKLGRDRQHLPGRADAACRACRRRLRGIRATPPARRVEETAGRAGPVLVGSAGRARWGLSHLVVAIGGTAALLAVAGIATGLGYGLAVGGAGTQTARMLGAGLAQLPAAAVMAGIAALALGAVPDACVAVAWTAIGLAVVLNIFGQALQLSHWVLDISPFIHAPGSPEVGSPSPRSYG
jgi:putative exporter of polyketide antibiotics